MEKKDLVIIGSGPAGYTAAIYAARAKLSVKLFEGFFSGPAGGQLMSTTDVENYPGFPEGVPGPELMSRMRAQAERFGTELETVDVEEVDFRVRPFVVKTKKTKCSADAVIIATGATAKRLDVPGTRDGELWQKGVTACAVCDGANPIFRNGELFVIGGGDTAMEEALFLTRYGSKVYIVHRRDQLRASKIMAQRALSDPKIEVLYNKVASKVMGTKVVDGIVLQDSVSGALSEHKAAGVFFAIGHEPNVSFLKGQIQLHPTGYIAIKPGTCQTNIAGVFAAGDVQDPTYRQAVTAAGSGCMAALEAERYLTHVHSS